MRDEGLRELEIERWEVENEILDAVVSYANEGSPANSTAIDGIAALGERLAELRNEITERGGQ